MQLLSLQNFSMWILNLNKIWSYRQLTQQQTRQTCYILRLCFSGKFFNLKKSWKNFKECFALIFENCFTIARLLFHKSLAPSRIGKVVHSATNQNSGGIVTYERAISLHHLWRNLRRHTTSKFAHEVILIGSFWRDFNNLLLNQSS